MMSTPPALLTPSPPVLISDSLDHKTQPGFRIEVVRVEDSDRVIDFLRNSFFVDEPMNSSLRLLEKPGDRCVPLEEFAAADIHQGLSVMAVDDDGKILGVLLGAAVHRHESEQVNYPTIMKADVYYDFSGVSRGITLDLLPFSVFIKDISRVKFRPKLG